MLNNYSNQQFSDSSGGDGTGLVGQDTNVDHWNLVTTTPALSGTITTRRNSGTASIASEVSMVRFTFEAILEPSSAALLGLAGLGLLSLA